MRARIVQAVLLAALSGCSLFAVRPEPAATAPAAVSTARAVHLARVRCLLVAPFENASDEPIAAEAATAAFVAAIDPNRTSVYPIAELRALFKDTSLELPEGVSPSLALELAELIGADAALYGAVEGRSRGTDPAVSVTIRLAATGARDLLFSKVVELVPRPEETTAELVRRAVQQAAGPMLERLGVPGRKSCFERQRTDRLRFMALAGEQRAAFPQRAPVTEPLPPAPAPGSTPAAPPAKAAPVALEPPPPTPESPQMAQVGEVEILAPIKRTPAKSIKVESGADLPAEPAPEPEAAPAEPEPPASPAAGPATATAKAVPATKPVRAPKKERRVAAVSPRPKGLTVRQADWLTRIQSGGRVLVDDVTFAGRSGQLDRDAGLQDVAAMLAAAPNLKLRVEGFVDASNDPDADLRTSMEMARTSGKRLIELGVARERLSWAGRGGEAPILPNFTARGRAANRRVESASPPTARSPSRPRRSPSARTTPWSRTSRPISGSRRAPRTSPSTAPRGRPSPCRSTPPPAR
jgi:outer membrane protein OmpA-like peptidoglycan-associated protein